MLRVEILEKKKNIEGEGTMEYKLRLIIIGVALFCLSLTWVAPAAEGDSCYKRLYIDGNFINGVFIDGNALTYPIDRITIGDEGQLWYMYNEYVGKLDEFAVYDGVLSQAQITAHWDARGNYNDYNDVVADDNPLLWLKLDETDANSGMVANNSGSANWRDGEYVVVGPNDVLMMKPTAGFVGGSSAIEFNVNGRVPELADQNGVCIDVWDGGEFTTSLNGMEDISIELWANYTDLNDYPRFFQHNGAWDNFSSYGLVTQLNDANVMVVLGAKVANYMEWAGDINDGQWHHIVVTYDNTYVEPNLPPVGTYVEEVNKDGPVLWIRFEGAPSDSSGNDYWVEYGGGTSIVEKVGGYGKSLRLDGGTANYAAAANGPNPPTSNTDHNDLYAFAPNDITVEMWYRTFPAGEQQPEEYAYFFQQSGVAGNDDGPGAGPYGQQILVLRGGAWWSGVNPKKNGEWHHLVVTFDEEPNSLSSRIYLDSVLENSSTVTGTTAKLGPELSHMMVGARNDRGYTYNNFVGYVDEFAIYDGILDPNRVLYHYAAWQPKSCQEAVDRGIVPAAWAVVDRKQDCRIDLYDFAIFAEEWAQCNDPAVGGPDCPPNWPTNP
jgi:hypothetical protein